MKEYGVKINYLYNSGFIVETKNHLLIFDYYKDSVDTGDKNISNGAIGENDLNIGKNVYVFSSHSHSDHFNPVIFSWINAVPDIKYVLSSDIKLTEPNSNISILSAYDSLSIDDLYIKAFGSTDIGISFLVLVDGISIFHAGDLNWWYWNEDSDIEIKKAESSFKEEIEKIKAEKIDISFFPTDPRLEDKYYLGGEYFIQEINPQILIPMHFGECFETTKNFSNKVKDLSTKVIEIDHRGQSILI